MKNGKKGLEKCEKERYLVKGFLFQKCFFFLIIRRKKLILLIAFFISFENGRKRNNFLNLFPYFGPKLYRVKRPEKPFRINVESRHFPDKEDRSLIRISSIKARGKSIFLNREEILIEKTKE